VTNFNSTTATQSVFVYSSPLPPSIPAGGGNTNGVISIDPNNPTPGGAYIPPFNPAQFYELYFPFYWSWP
jgi:hypothetical protein